MAYPRLTDAELLSLDVPALLAVAFRAGTRIDGTVTVAAALAAARVGTEPRSLTFLAEIVRRGGVGYAAQLAEPLPTPAQCALAVSWLAAAGSGTGDAVRDEAVARWLDNVATVLGVRRRSASPALGPTAAPPGGSAT
jgi:hypothetical protein